MSFSYAAAFWLWPQWEEQTQVHGPVYVSTSWNDWHGGSGEFISFLKSSFTIKKFLETNSSKQDILLGFCWAQNGPLGQMGGDWTQNVYSLYTVKTVI